MNLQWLRHVSLPLLLVLAGGTASAQVTGRNFDHLTTGFELTGAHRLQACESCHVDAVFAGTPRVCAACHAQDDVHHGQFGRQCQRCHGTTTFKGARMR